MANLADELDNIDRAILNIIQSEFQLKSHPYFIIGQ